MEENGGRIGVMDEHLKNVQQEITYTESRVSDAAFSYNGIHAQQKQGLWAHINGMAQPGDAPVSHT